jgi:hypothetical protein
MARLHMNTVLAALSTFVFGVFLGVNLSNPIRCSSAVHISADAALEQSDFKTRSNADILPPAVAAKDPPPNSVDLQGPPSTSVEVTDRVSNSDRVYTFSGRPAPTPVDGYFQAHGADCPSSSVKLFPSTKVSKECAWILDLDAHKSLGYSAYHQDAILETIFNLIGRTNKFYVEFGFGYGHFDTEEDMHKAGLNSKHRVLPKDAVFDDCVLPKDAVFDDYVLPKDTVFDDYVLPKDAVFDDLFHQVYCPKMLSLMICFIKSTAQRCCL